MLPPNFRTSTEGSGLWPIFSSTLLTKCIAAQGASPQRTITLLRSPQFPPYLDGLNQLVAAYKNNEPLSRELLEYIGTSSQELAQAVRYESEDLRAAEDFIYESVAAFNRLAKR